MPFMMDEPRVWLELTLPYAVLRLRQTNGQAVWRRVGAMVSVVHALQRQTLVQIHLQNDLIGLIQPGFVVAHRGRRDQPPPGKMPATSTTAISRWPSRPDQTACATCDKCMSL